METVKNEIIVKLNAFVDVKLAKISKGKRPQAKVDREAAKYILANMDDRDALANIVEQESKEKTLSGELFNVLAERIKQLDNENAATARAAQLKSLGIDPDRVDVPFAVAYKDGSVEFYVSRKESVVGSGPLFRQYDKETNAFGNNLMPIPTGEVTAVAYGDKAIRALVKGKVAVKDLPAFLKKKATSEPTEKKSTTTPKKTTNSNTGTGNHAVGDLHPNGKWVWTEYKPGKFDWRTRPELKKANGAKRNNDSKTSTKVTKPKAKKADTPTTKVTIKQGINKDAKDKNNITICHGMTVKVGDGLYAAQLDPDDDKVKVVLKSSGLTAIEDIDPKALDVSFNYSVDEGLKDLRGKLSNAQDKVVKLLKKGYRLAVIDGASFLRHGTDNRRVDMPTLNAIFFGRAGRKLLPYNIGYIGKLSK